MAGVAGASDAEENTTLVDSSQATSINYGKTNYLLFSPSIFAFHLQLQPDWAERMRFSEWPTLIAAVPQDWPEQLNEELPRLRRIVSTLPPNWEATMKQVSRKPKGCVES